MEASRPLGHPTPAEMEPPQLEQALALAEMARERCKLSYSTCSPSLLESGDENGTSPGGHTASTGLIPLALAWEGSALALLAARGKSAKYGFFTFPKGGGLKNVESTVLTPERKLLLGLRFFLSPARCFWGLVE